MRWSAWWALGAFGAGCAPFPSDEERGDVAAVAASADLIVLAQAALADRFAYCDPDRERSDTRLVATDARCRLRYGGGDYTASLDLEAHRDDPMGDYRGSYTREGTLQIEDKALSVQTTGEVRLWGELDLGPPVHGGPHQDAGGLEAEVTYQGIGSDPVTAELSATWTDSYELYPAEFVVRTPEGCGAWSLSLFFFSDGGPNQGKVVFSDGFEIWGPSGC